MHVNDASVESRNTPAIIRETENTLEWLEWWPGGPTGIRICSKGKYSCEWHMRECICREQRAQVRPFIGASRVLRGKS